MNKGCSLDTGSVWQPVGCSAIMGCLLIAGNDTWNAFVLLTSISVVVPWKGMHWLDAQER